ncbi:TIGR00266 family protein [bacterium]|nr:TIGR00266 family protein [bacterium]
MEYDITGDNLPVLECRLREGESVICQRGAMSWMSSNMVMNTSGGSIDQIIARLLTRESLFVNRYTPSGGSGYIAFASSLPGSIMALEITPGREIICQKGAFLACTAGVEQSMFFTRSLGAGFFGGEGFIMQRFTGEGMLFVEIDGSVVTKDLQAGESIIIDTGYLAVMDGTCTIDVRRVRGGTNMFFGGEGLFNTVVTGPGQVMLQTMPLSKLQAHFIRG